MLGQLEILETGEEDTERREKPGASRNSCRNTVEQLSVVKILGIPRFCTF
jgi:ribosomal protein S14